MQQGSIKYFRTCSLTYEDDTILLLQPKEKEQEKEKEKTPQKHLLCIHPHGIFCMGWAVLFGRQELSHVKFCFSTALYNSPFFRVLALLVGNPAPADKKTFQKLMSAGHSLALIPGGFESASISCSTQPRVHVSKKGFIKYALVHGYALVPAYVFNEHKCYDNMQGGFSFRFWLNSFGLPAIVPFGKWCCPMLPKSAVDLHVVVGKPLQLPELGQEVSREMVNKWHGKYVKELVALYDRNKSKYGEKKELEVW